MKWALLALVSVIAGAYWLFLGREREEVVNLVPTRVEAPPSVPASAPVQGLRLQEGHATKRDATRVQVGEELGDEVRTDSDGYALFAGSGSTIRLGPDTQLLLKQRDDRHYEFFLAGGTVEASSDGPRLDFFGAGTTGFVRIENGAARLLADGQRGLVVGAERGSVRVSNAGKELIVPVGQATRLLAQKAPDQLWKIPAAMLLRVNWPKDSELATRKLRVTGTASPGTLVRAQNQRVLVEDDGRFAIDLPLSEGVNAVHVRAEDPGGRKEQSKFKVRVDTTPAEAGVETSPDMWKKKNAPPK